MPVLTTTRTYVDGDTLAQADLDGAFNSIETFVNTTKLDSTNIQSGGISNASLAANAVGSTNIQTGAVTFAALDASILNLLTPTGIVSAFTGATAPSGWLMCDGSAVSRSTYAALFLVMASAHGSGDGSTTFNLPDYRGRFLRGQNHATGRDPDAAARTAMATGGNTGDTVGSVQDQAFLSHNHTLTDPNHSHPLPSQNLGLATGGATEGILNNSVGTGYTSSAVSTGITIAAAGTTETRPLNASVNWIVKT